ncbi:MAG: S-layer homology domain-containing protein [Candidatus Gracilibacteria bacterium]|jgi:hypothetical protein
MQKKSLYLLVLVALVAMFSVSVFMGPTAPVRAETIPFPDVSATNPHFSAIMSLVDQGILEGYSDGTFKPDQEVNRAEALKIILMAMSVSIGTGTATGFSDVPATEWYAPYVGTAAAAGIVSGYSDGSFLPGQTVNRAEAVKMLTLAGGSEIGSAESSFSDVSVDSWYAAYASYAKKWNLEPVQTDGLWHADAAISRANLAEMVYRMQKIKQSGSGFDESTNWQRGDFPAVDISMKVPFGWGVKQEGVGSAFLLDSANGQISLLNPYANGGTLLMTRYMNTEGASASDVFAGIRARLGVESEVAQIGGFDALVVYDESGLSYRQWYLAMPNGEIVNFWAMRGDGAYSPYLEWFFDTMIASVEFSASSDSGLTIDEIVSDLRGAIQVDGTGEQMMALLSDWELFETDAIGVGTGPVDYYYSPSANITLKYERSFDVILDLRDGETSAF